MAEHPNFFSEGLDLDADQAKSEAGEAPDDNSD
jgi:hypothetical protein